MNETNYYNVPVWSYIFGGWNQDDFIQWHIALVKEYGKDSANNIFIDAWNNAPFLSKQISYRNSALPNNELFIAYAQDNDFYDALFSGLLGSVASVENGTARIIKSVPKIVNTIANDVESVSNYFNIIIIIVIFILLWIYIPDFKKVFKK